MSVRSKTFVCLLLLFPWVGRAQWTTQTLELHQGWNAVYLTVQPVPSSCDTIFSGLDVERVVMWDRTKGGAEYVSDVSEELPRSPDWKIWRPATADESELNTLSMLLAGEAYLINMNAAATLQLKGRAELVHPSWLPNEMTLTGVPVAEGVTFSRFFSHTDEIGVDSTDDGEIYEVQADGSELQIYRPTLSNIAQGKAYWIKTGQTLDYDGSLDVSLSGEADWLDFGSEIVARTVKLRNVTETTNSVTLSLSSGEALPQLSGSESYPVAEGPVPLSYVVFNPASGLNEFVPMPVALSTNVPPYSTVEITLMPRINEMASEDADAVWESILTVTDGEVEQQIGIQSMQAKAPTGLWVGTVAVDAVSRAPSKTGASNVWDSVSPVAVSRPYTFRVLVHVAEDGTCRLLQRAMPVWVVENDVTETYIFTDADYAEQFKQDHAAATVSRISSANFPIMDPLEMSGTFGGTNLSCTVLLPFNDSVNPFVHPFHPDHDNKEYHNGEASDLGEGVESFDVTREITFDFMDTDPLGSNPGWNYSEHGGLFKETVTGLNKTIYVEGAFRLEKVSDCGVLSYLEQ